MAIWLTFVVRPIIFSLGITVIVGIGGMIAFIYPQLNIKNVIGEEKRLLLNIIEKKHHEILIKYLSGLDKVNERNNKILLLKELGGLSDLSNNIQSILEWPFDYKTFLTVLGGAILPFVSILISVLGLM